MAGLGGVEGVDMRHVNVTAHLSTFLAQSSARLSNTPLGNTRPVMEVLLEILPTLVPTAVNSDTNRIPPETMPGRCFEKFFLWIVLVVSCGTSLSTLSLFLDPGCGCQRGPSFAPLPVFPKGEFGASTSLRVALIVLTTPNAGGGPRHVLSGRST